MDELLASLGLNDLGQNTFGSPLAPAPPAFPTPAVPPNAMASAASGVGAGSPDAATASTAPTASQSGFNADSFMKALQGVKAPTVPTPQKVATPHPPSVAPIHGGNLMALLASLGVPAQSTLSNYRLPSTLSNTYGGPLGLR